MSSRSKAKGFTLIELLVVVGFQVVVLGTVATLLVHTLTQVGQNSAGLASLQQATAVMEEIQKTVRQATSCEVVSKSGVQGLKCTMPSNASDTDADGVHDTFLPSEFDDSSRAKYAGSGQRHWYYMGNSSSGTFGSSGKMIWRAVLTDDSEPSPSTTDKNWSKYYGKDYPRYFLVSDASFSVNSGSQTVNVTLTASAAQHAPDRGGETASTSDLQSVTLSQTIPWRTYFE